MNAVLMEQLVNQLLDLPDDGFNGGHPVTDQTGAALKDAHHQAMLIDTMFRVMARDVIDVVGVQLDVHTDDLSIGLNIPDSTDPKAPRLVISTLTGYLCGKPDTAHQSLLEFLAASRGRMNEMFGTLVGVALVIRRRTVNITVGS